ncbi:alpha/beta hydrolase [Egibacter rhizosphaerae]|uniref:Alpha/beta hydrolase n=1 Tax=Egibacter rhizosphaerae TaxID=1670831 RepID=A0A411YC03_9ACTN|nr:alpha/beta family hydrolase [Egibacter rhizosphaerae]QBI18783.1 alpha/beta hydrolase [Egibacter rhizosphaerae]
MPTRPTAPEDWHVPVFGPQAVPAVTATARRPLGDRGELAVVLAPGAGSDRHDAPLAVVADRLAARGHPTLVLQFAYTEAGRGRPDPLERCGAVFAEVAGHLRERLGDERPLILGGRSMGGRVASLIASDEDEPVAGVAGVALLAYPLHPARPLRDAEPVPRERLRTAHWPDLRVPSLFVQGDRDRLCDLATLEAERAAHLEARRTSVHVVAGADHGFEPRRRDGRATADVHREVAEVVGDWVDGLADQGRAT